MHKGTICWLPPATGSSTQQKLPAPSWDSAAGARPEQVAGQRATWEAQFPILPRQNGFSQRAFQPLSPWSLWRVGGEASHEHSDIDLKGSNQRHRKICFYSSQEPELGMQTPETPGVWHPAKQPEEALESDRIPWPCRQCSVARAWGWKYPGAAAWRNTRSL